MDDDFTGDVAKASKKLGFTRSAMDSRANDATLEEERHMINRDGEKVPGFASSVVPTIEEQVISERKPERTSGSDKPIKDELDEGEKGEAGVAESNGFTHGTEPSQSRVQDGSGQLFGAPADAAKYPKTDDEPPHAQGAPNDADDIENAAVGARKILRQHLSVKVGTKPWTIPTPRPEVDPSKFDDPVSDSFYKDVWLACATHNVSLIFIELIQAFADFTW